MFPLAKSVGEALHLYGQTEIGKNHIAGLARIEQLKQQWDNRLGDVAKADADKDEDGHEPFALEREESDGKHPKVRHAQASKKPRKPTSHDGYTPPGHARDAYGSIENNADSEDDPNAPMNWPEAKLARYCDSLASEHAAQYGVSKSEAYDRLLKSDPAFGIAWRAATALPSE